MVLILNVWKCEALRILKNIDPCLGLETPILEKGLVTAKHISFAAMDWMFKKKQNLTLSRETNFCIPFKSSALYHGSWQAYFLSGLSRSADLSTVWTNHLKTYCLQDVILQIFSNLLKNHAQKKLCKQHQVSYIVLNRIKFQYSRLLKIHSNVFFHCSVKSFSLEGFSELLGLFFFWSEIFIQYKA